MKKQINLIFPHQLFATTPFINNGFDTCIIEEMLFFNQYQFHKQKIAYHRATMQYYYDYLCSNGLTNITYIEAQEPLSDVRALLKHFKQQGYQTIHYVNVCDDWLEKRIKMSAQVNEITTKRYQSPSFINSTIQLRDFFKPHKKKFYLTSFYKSERKRLGILIETNGEPTGNQWSFDNDNRKKYPKNKKPPQITHPSLCRFYQESYHYVEKHFKDNPGELSTTPLYPIDHDSSQKWLSEFLVDRFEEFGPYEDAIVSNEHFLNHSVLSPMLNNGLLTPKDVIAEIQNYAEHKQIAINSYEGLIRQIIGWREYIRGIYLVKGSMQRTRNYWNFTRKIPTAFYHGTTGIEPIDDCIKKLLTTAYSHHIERLMILGNFMMLCEFDPDQVYQWFMEMYIDAYDWVMVPNIYGMSQFSDGGLMSTKPYISGSNYLIKMSNYKKDQWCETWDGLFWRFINKYQDFFLSNPRTAVMVHNFNRMNSDKKMTLLNNAEHFLKHLD